LKLINNEARVFANMSINPVVQIFANDRHECSGGYATPVLHEIFLLHFVTPSMDVAYAFKNRIIERPSQSAALLTDTMLYEAP
jgi:hypothetical protein